jgi:hypothetical protein
MTADQIKVLSVAISLAVLLATQAQAENVAKRKTPAPRMVTSQTQAPIYGWAGQYRGTDPDPNIRFQLMRDQNLR